MQSGTLRDYSAVMYKVYFEIGEHQEIGLGVLSAFVGERHSKHILHLEFGYEVAIPIQAIPEIVKRL